MGNILKIPLVIASTLCILHIRTRIWFVLWFAFPYWLVLWPFTKILLASSSLCHSKWICTSQYLSVCHTFSRNDRLLGLHYWILNIAIFLSQWKKQRPCKHLLVLLILAVCKFATSLLNTYKWSCNKVPGSILNVWRHHCNNIVFVTDWS